MYDNSSVDDWLEARSNRYKFRDGQELINSWWDRFGRSNMWARQKALHQRWSDLGWLARPTDPPGYHEQGPGIPFSPPGGY